MKNCPETKDTSSYSYPQLTRHSLNCKVIALSSYLARVYIIKIFISVGYIMICFVHVYSYKSIFLSPLFDIELGLQSNRVDYNGSLWYDQGGSSIHAGNCFWNSSYPNENREVQGESIMTRLGNLQHTDKWSLQEICQHS